MSQHAKSDDERAQQATDLTEHRDEHTAQDSGRAGLMAERRGAPGRMGALAPDDAEGRQADGRPDPADPAGDIRSATTGSMEPDPDASDLVSSGSDNTP